MKDNYFTLDLTRHGLKQIPLLNPKVHWLILSNNQLLSTTNIEYYKEVTRLALNDNSLLRVTETINALCDLNWLDLTRNRLTNLPMLRLPYLNGLGLSENNFSLIPSSVFTLTNLRKFGFFSNKLRVISPLIGNLVRLTKLDLSNNKIGALPKELFSLKRLTWLNLSNNQIRCIDGINSLRFLEELGLGNNLIERVDIRLENLKVLPLFNNRIRTARVEAAKIEKLDFSDNLIEEFDWSILEYRKLKYLNLKSNRIRAVVMKEKEKQRHCIAGIYNEFTIRRATGHDVRVSSGGVSMGNSGISNGISMFSDSDRLSDRLSDSDRVRGADGRDDRLSDRVSDRLSDGRGDRLSDGRGDRLSDGPEGFSIREVRERIAERRNERARMRDRIAHRITDIDDDVDDEGNHASPINSLSIDDILSKYSSLLKKPLPATNNSFFNLNLSKNLSVLDLSSNRLEYIPFSFYFKLKNVGTLRLGNNEYRGDLGLDSDSNTGIDWLWQICLTRVINRACAAQATDGDINRAGINRSEVNRSEVSRADSAGAGVPARSVNLVTLSDNGIFNNITLNTKISPNNFPLSLRQCDICLRHFVTNARIKYKTYNEVVLRFVLCSEECGEGM